MTGDLARRLADGDETAFEELFDALGRELLAYAGSLLGCPQDAEDAVQSAMIRLVRHRSRLTGVVNLKAYVFRTVRNEALRGRERPAEAARRAEAIRRAETARETGEPECIEPGGAGLQDDLYRMIATLPPEQAETVSLKYFGGMTFEEIGEVTGVSPNTAASRHRYAIEKLRAMMEGVNER